MNTVDVLTLAVALESTGISTIISKDVDGGPLQLQLLLVYLSCMLRNVEEGCPQRPLSSEISLCKATLTDSFFFFFCTLMCKEGRS